MHISVTFLRITFFVHFFKTFSSDSKSAWNSAFFYTHIEFLNKNFFALISTFCTLWLQMRRKRLKKTENLFLWMCLRILLGNHQRVCITKLLISLYPTVQALTEHWTGNFWYFNTVSKKLVFLRRFPCTTHFCFATSSGIHIFYWGTYCRSLAFISNSNSEFCMLVVNILKSKAK